MYYGGYYRGIGGFKFGIVHYGNYGWVLRVVDIQGHFIGRKGHKDTLGTDLF